MTIHRSASINNANIKTRWEEPYVSSAINTEMASMPRGVYRGFIVEQMDTPGAGVKIKVKTDSDSFLIHKSKADGFVNAVRYSECFDFVFSFSNPGTVTIYIWVDVIYAESSDTVGYLRAGDGAERGDDSVTLAKIVLTGGSTTIYDADITQDSSDPDTFLTPIADSSEENEFGFMTESMVNLLPTSDQKDAMDSASSPDASNAFAVEDESSEKYFAKPVVKSFSYPSGVFACQPTGWFFVGNGGTGTANKFFRPYITSTDKELLGSDDRKITILQVNKSDNSAEIDPSTDATDGFYENPIVYFDFSETDDSKVYDFDVLCGERTYLKNLDASDLIETVLGFHPNVHSDVWQNVVQRYRYMKEGIDEIDSPNVFRVDADKDSLKRELDIYLSKQGKSGTASDITDICTDGKYIFYVQNLDEVYCVDPETDSQIWFQSADADVDVICTDGLYLYLAYNGVTNGVRIWDRDDGSLVKRCQNTDTGTYTDIDANGEYVVATLGNKAYCWDVSQGDLYGYEWIHDHGAALNAVCVDFENAYIGGTVGTSGEIISIVKLSSGASVGYNDFSGFFTAAPTVNKIVTDGLRIFFCIDRQGLSAGGNASVLALSRPWSSTVGQACDLLWTFDTGSNVDYMHVDDLNLYSGLGLYIFALDKQIGSVEFKINIDGSAGYYPYDGDGETVLCIRELSGNADYWARLKVSRPTTIYQRVNGDDPYRKPFYNLAIPERVR